MKKRWGTMLLAGLLGTALLSGCGSSASDSASSAAESNPSETTTTAEGTKEDLIFVNYRDIRDLNPHLYAGEMYAQEMLYEGLVNITSDGFEGCLAESWDVSDDGKVYTFHIRPGVTFSDGEKCDAYAIKANFDAILENKDRHTWLEMMHLLVGVDAPDENTFVIELSEPYYPLLTELGVTRPFAMISPKAMKNGSTKDGVEAYIGTGPYVLDEFVTDEYAVFKANPNYWGEQPAIKTITVKVIPDNQTRILALEKGEIDMIFGKNMIDADAINQYLDSDQFTVELSDPTSTRQIVLNTSSDILSEKDVRSALQVAQTQRHIVIHKIFCHTSCHCWGHIRPEHQHVVVPVEELEHFLGAYASAVFIKNIRIFKTWGLDMLITVKIQCMEDFLLNCQLSAAFSVINVPDSFRSVDQFVFLCHGTSPLSFADINGFAFCLAITLPW